MSRPAPRTPSLGALPPLALLPLLLAACADPVTAPPSLNVDVAALRPSLALTGTTSILRVCKDAGSPAGTYVFTAIAGGNDNPGDELIPAFSLTVPTPDATHACADVFRRVDADDGGDQPALITITEAPSLGTVLAAVTVTTYGPNAPITTPAPVIDLVARSATIPVNAYHGALTTFFNSAVAQGCTYTQGWYKNRGAASLPPGAFFLSGQTYLQVLDTPPQKGNMYYVFAHQYIAAAANSAAGSGVPAAVQTALDGGTAYFGVATPSNPVPAGYVRSQLEAWASTLDEYNNGRLGPLHCD